MSGKVKKKHICILICFNNYEHIVESFESLYNDEIDFFIVENLSLNSEKIKKYFLNKNIIGYIQFQDNITNNAVNIFLENYYHLISEYEYITFSDCDLRIDDSKKVFNEIKNILEFKDVAVSCVDIDISNLPKINGSSKWVSTPIEVTDNYVESRTGIHLMTLKNKNLWVVKDVKFLDSKLYEKVKSKNNKWVKTVKNKAYHLTWDLYSENNDYFKFKLGNTHSDLWLHDKKSNYLILV